MTSCKHVYTICYMCTVHLCVRSAAAVGTRARDLAREGKCPGVQPSRGSTRILVDPHWTSKAGVGVR